jgi:WD40 repeat protein
MKTSSLHKQLEIREHSMAVYDLAVDSSGQIYSGSADTFVARWNHETGKQDLFAVKSEFPVYSLSLISDTQLAIGLSNGNLHIIDTVSKKEVRFFTQHRSAIFAQIHLDRAQIHLTGDADGNLAVWNTQDWSLLLFLPLACDKIRTLATNADQSLVAVGSRDGKVRLFETAFFNEIHSFYAHQDGVNALAFDPNDSDNLYSGGKDGYLRIWKWRTGEKIKAIPAHNFAVYGIAFSPDRTHFVTCSRDKSIKLWDKVHLSVLQKIEAKQGAHSHSVNRIYWNAYGVFSCGDDRRILRFDPIS